jgi:tetratricopeptide (TPR) repeat protein
MQSRRGRLVGGAAGATLVLAIAAAMLAIGGIAGAGPAAERPGATAPVATRPDPLVVAIDRSQQRLRRVPGDWTTWASLGMAYLERARITADPTLYSKADGALHESLRLRPRGNDAALTGLGALANARHDFAAARQFAQDALAGNPYSAEAVGVLVDAHTQLGEAAQASAAAQRMLDLRPGLPAYARAAYDLEQRGEVARAEELLRQALDNAMAPADIGFVRSALGDLAWHRGDLAAAAAEYAAGIAASPEYLPLAVGQARVAAARGDGLARWEAVVRRSPTPGLLIEYAWWLRAADRPSDVSTVLDWAGAALDLFTANGGTDDLTAAELAIARGDAASAVRLAGHEWGRRKHADIADTLAWALHLAGRPREALDYARLADATGARDAARAYHLGMIELALGDRVGARRDLGRAVAHNPYFSPVDGPVAARTLAGLGGAS